MPPLVPLSFTEQVVGHLRREITRGVWSGEIPGAPSLAKELGVDPKTVLAALDLLERENWLVAQGPGRRRRINHDRTDDSAAAPLRIAILPHDQSDRRVDYILELQDKLVLSGHRAYYSSQTIQNFGSDRGRLERFVKREKADAWIVVSGSQQLLQWFAGIPHPAFALFGSYEGLPIAGTIPEKNPAYHRMVDRLVALGHRRISLLVREDRRIPEPGRSERAFLERLERHGIKTSAYNLPEWKEGGGHFREMLTELFRYTPPTALITQEGFVFNAVYHFLAQHKLQVPRDVSLACSSYDSSFMWCDPPVSHIFWDSKPITRRVVKWAANVSRGKKDIRQSRTKSEWVEGGTIGPVKRG